MAANQSFSGSSDDTIEFARPVNYLNISVESGVTFSFSLDGSVYLELPSGFHSFSIGATDTVHISSDGAWNLIGVQA